MPPNPEEQLAYLGFHLIAPSVLLRPYVQSYWYIRPTMPLTAPREEFMHPGGGYGIVFNLGESLYLDGQPFRESIFLDGTNTMTRKMGFQGQMEQLGIRFHPGGAYPFLGIPLIALQNEVALLNVLENAPLLELYARLWEAKSLSARINMLEQWLEARLSGGKAIHPLIPPSLARLRSGRGTSWSIPDLAEEFAISQRQLERLYRSQVGMSPKQYAQIIRVEKARLALKNPHAKPQQAGLAVELGYYDQAHFIHEFKTVTGMTPHHYLNRQPR